MLRASIMVDPAVVVAPVRRRTFGSFVEHLGRCVYTGIYEPGHPKADDQGFRADVAELVRELGVTTIRYPGGNFVSGYRWEDGVGPVESRPRRLDLAWHSLETNAFGTNEFLAWTKAQGVEPMMAVNLGTRGIQEALDLLEYCNVREGSALASLRRSHGVLEPHGVTMWCLGNEMDGPWQLGHKTATEYGRLAAETARAMRMVDPDLVLVACGSSGSGMPTFGEWERTVLDLAYDQIDMISAHAYYEEKDGDRASFLASAVDMDHFIETVAGIADEVKEAKGGTKDIAISFDEWNVWYITRPESEVPKGEWPQAPRLLEDVYTATDAVVVGGLLIALLRHSDRVHAASLAQLVNVIAPIMTDPGGDAWRQATFHPFALTSRHARGDVLDAVVESPRHATERFGEVASVDAVATWDREAGVGSVFAVNRDPARPLEFVIDATALGGATSAEGTVVVGADDDATNTSREPHRVAPRPLEVRREGTSLTVTLPPASWAMIRLESQPRTA
jgi:alpha-N-arabinofuranosidase